MFRKFIHRPVLAIVISVLIVVTGEVNSRRRQRALA